MRIALDTNVLAYAAGIDDARRRDRALGMLETLSGAALVLPQQAAGELYNVLRRKGAHPAPVAAQVVRSWATALELAPSTTTDFGDALMLAETSGLQIWDAMILATAASAGCALLLSEDLQDGFVYRGTTVANPFAETLHPLLASVLETSSGSPR